jgi:hypothetical protein
MILGAAIGSLTYDLAIKLKISYNQETPKTMCNKGIAFEQIDIGSTVYIKTDKQCINETMKGKQYDNRDTKQNPR